MAAVLAGMVTYYFNLRVRASNARHGMIQIVAAADELPAGIPLATNDLALVEWPEGATPVVHRTWVAGREAYGSAPAGC